MAVGDGVCSDIDCVPDRQQLAAILGQPDGSIAREELSLVAGALPRGYHLPAGPRQRHRRHGLRLQVRKNLLSQIVVGVRFLSVLSFTMGEGHIDDSQGSKSTHNQH